MDVHDFVFNSNLPLLCRVVSTNAGRCGFTDDGENVHADRYRVNVQRKYSFSLLSMCQVHIAQGDYRAKISSEAYEQVHWEKRKGGEKM
jgi:hypothetical protein